MRVVYFSRDYTPHDRRFLEALAGSEHQIQYLRLEDRGRAAESRPVPSGVQVVDWWGGRRPLGWRDVPRARRAVKRVLAELAPDLVHAGPVQRPALLAALAGFRPLVTLSWGSDLLWEARKGPGKWAAQYTLARSDVLACDCETVRRRAIELGMAEDRIVVFPWGVDLAHFSPAVSRRLRIDLGWEQAFVVLSTRAWEPLLGTELLVSAFLQAAEACPELRLLMLGGGSLGPGIRSQLRAAGMLDRVHFAGQVEFDRLPDYYRAADLYMSASRSDGSSISLLEALACGLPALVSDIPGNREWVEPGVNGWWFPDGDVHAAAHGLLGACRSPADARRMRRQARQVAEARADWRKHFPQLLRAYEMAVSGR